MSCTCCNTRIRLAADYVVSNNLTCADLAADTEVLQTYHIVARRAAERLQSRLLPVSFDLVRRLAVLLQLQCSEPCLRDEPCPSPSSKKLRLVLPLPWNVSEGMLQAAINLADNLRLAERYGEGVRTALGPAHPWAPLRTTTSRGNSGNPSSSAGGRACVEGVPAGSPLATAACPLLPSPLTMADTSSALVALELRKASKVRQGGWPENCGCAPGMVGHDGGMGRSTWQGSAQDARGLQQIAWHRS